MAPHSSTLAWKIPWMEAPGGLQSMGSLRSDTTEWLHFYFSLSCIGEGNGNQLQCSCLENPGDRGDWWAAVYGVAQSQTRLKRLSSSSSCHNWREKHIALVVQTMNDFPVLSPLHLTPWSHFVVKYSRGTSEAGWEFCRCVGDEAVKMTARGISSSWVWGFCIVWTRGPKNLL